MFDKFAKLRAIESGQAPASSTASNVRLWNYEKDGNVMGTIIDFNSFTGLPLKPGHLIISKG
jgi:hypothetical protein